MPHESGVMPMRLRLRAGFIAAKVSARLSARRRWGCLILFLCAVAGSVWLVVELPLVVFSFFFPDVWCVAFFSFLTISADAPGKQSTSVVAQVTISEEAGGGVEPPSND